jgi:dsRNA-specific ribonuclease
MSLRARDKEQLEERLGYAFNNPALLARALTHSSAVSPSRRTSESYQRLEFLGDRVLGLVVAHMLSERLPKSNEGDLSRTLNSLVRKETCARVARKLDLGVFINLGESEARTGGAEKDAILGDVCEAVIGAIYADGGLDPAFTFVSRMFGDNLDVLRAMQADSVDLIYLDPPFNSNADYNVIFREHTSGARSHAQIAAFEDTWVWGKESAKSLDELITVHGELAELLDLMARKLGHNAISAYLVMMAPRVVEMYRVLKSTGSLYLHCDPTASHYLKLILDMIFGARSFRGEIIWKRITAHSDARRRTGEAMVRRLLSNGQQLTHGAEILLQRERALGEPPARRLLLELGSPGHLVGACLIGHICLANILTRPMVAVTLSRDTTVQRKRGRRRWRQQRQARRSSDPRTRRRASSGASACAS